MSQESVTHHAVERMLCINARHCRTAGWVVNANDNPVIPLQRLFVCSLGSLRFVLFLLHGLRRLHCLHCLHGLWCLHGLHGHL